MPSFDIVSSFNMQEVDLKVFQNPTGNDFKRFIVRLTLKGAKNV